MILILAFLLWGILLAVVAVATGIAGLIYAATALTGLAVALASVLLALSLRSPDLAAERRALREARRDYRGMRLAP